jgi:hypothetical protein
MAKEWWEITWEMKQRIIRRVQVVGAKAVIKEMPNILISEELKNWFQVALKDRLGREPTADERDFYMRMADKLQTHYEVLLSKANRGVF